MGIGLFSLERRTMMTMLTVVNACLATLGEAPINDLDEDHPLVAAALATITAIDQSEQAKEWWFNREIATLHPDPETGHIYVPADALNVDPTVANKNWVQRGRRLYDALNGTYNLGDRPVQVNLVRHVPFEDLPPLFQSWVSICSQVKFQSDFDGDEQKYRRLAAEKSQVMLTLNSTQIRNVQANLLRNPSLQAKLQRIGGLHVGINPTRIGGR